MPGVVPVPLSRTERVELTCMLTFLVGAVLTAFLLLPAALVHGLWPLPLIAATHTPIVAVWVAGKATGRDEQRAPRSPEPTPAT